MASLICADIHMHTHMPSKKDISKTLNSFPNTSIYLIHYMKYKVMCVCWGVFYVFIGNCLEKNQNQNTLIILNLFSQE